MRVPLTSRDFLDRGAAVYGRRIGVHDEPDEPASLGHLTYGALASRAKALAAGFDELGIEPGDRVAVVSPNSARLLELLYATTMTGRILVPINFRLNAQEVSYIVQDSGACLLLASPELKDDLIAVDAKHRFLLGPESDEALLRPGREPAAWSADEDAVATINYTSGTTAHPKGVELTHRALWTNAVTFGLHIAVTDRDVYLHTLPLFHVNGWGMPFTMAGLGVPQVILRKVDGAEILRRVQSHGVTLMSGAPAVIAAILDAAQTWAGVIPGSGRTRFVCAGAPPPTRLIERVESELGWEFLQIYGLTETSPLLTINRSRSEWDDLPPTDRALLLSRAGAPSLGTQLRIDPTGEIVVKTNHALAGYWGNPKATEEALAGDEFHTGDGGTIGDDGYLTISDRKKDVIITGGENVSSIEVEDRLYSHPEVVEAAVFGVPDEKWGETVMALVVTVAGSEVTEKALIDFCRASLAHYKCPTKIELREDIPRTATGKIQKFKLRQPYWQGRERQVN